METKYKVNNLLMIPLNHKDNYINIPEKILDSIVKKLFNPPFYFKLSANNGLKTYVGVKEFTAQKQTIEVPQHLIEYLASEKANLCLVTEIPKGEFVKLKVNDNSFYDIPEYDLFLTTELSKYCLLDKNQNITFTIINKNYTFTIQELKIKIDNNLFDAELVDIVNIDLKVDFEREIKKVDIPNRIFPKDINIKKHEKEKSYFDKFKSPGNKLSNNPESLTKEQIRQRRLERYEKIFKATKEDL